MAKKQTMDHAQLLVLSLLAGEDMYGYQMIVELARRSDHTFEMKAGTRRWRRISRRPPPAGCGNTTALPAGGRRCCGRRLPPGRPTPAR